MCFRASVLLCKASALKRIDVRYGPQNALNLNSKDTNMDFYCAISFYNEPFLSNSLSSKSFANVFLLSGRCVYSVKTICVFYH